MRLHGSILGYLAKTPATSINYHNKCSAWSKEVGIPEDYQIDLDNINIEHITCRIQEGISTGFKQTRLSIHQALNQSLSNWSMQHEKCKFYSSYSAI